jgi:hypothetical protein
MTPMPIGEEIGIWVAALLTFMMFTFLYKDNPVFKLGEHIFLGVALGYSLSTYYYQNIYPEGVAPLLGNNPDIPKNMWVAIPMVLGLFILLRMIPKLAWLSRYSFAVYIGGWAGITIPTEMAGRLLPQITATMRPLQMPVSVLMSQILLIIGVLCTVVYFFFSLEHKGAVGRISRFGVVFIMIAMGASFGNTVMARVSLLIGRFQFLLYDWIQGVMLHKG